MKNKTFMDVVRIITSPQAPHLSDTFLLGNHLERVKSNNEFYYGKVFFYILFTTVKAFYQRKIPSVTTASVSTYISFIVMHLSMLSPRVGGGGGGGGAGYPREID